MIKKALVVFYILVGVIPYFGTADKVHPQTLYISILNIVSLGLIIYNSGFTNTLNNLKKAISHKQTLFYFLFAIVALISTLQSINFTQSLIKLAEIFSQLFAFTILIYLISTIKDLKRFFISSIVFLCVVELASTLYPYLMDIVNRGYPIDRSLEYRGVSGSVNIISYLLLMKLPFIYYLSIVNKKYRFLYILISVLILYSITVIHQTRSAILLSFLVSSFIIAVFLYNRNVIKKTSPYSLKTILLTTVFPLVTVLALSNLQSSFFNKTDAVQDRLSSINLEEYSTNARLRYYSQAIKYIISNPLGVGVGNWQLASIDADKDNIEAYVIPYHVHNDFLEISAETSVIGGILYYMITLSIFFLLLKKIIQSIKRRKPLEYETLFFTVLGIWIIDSMFNFPATRVLQQIHLLFIIAVIMNYYNLKPLNINRHFNNVTFYIMLASLPLVLASSIRLVQSSVDQRILLTHYNLADFSIPLEVIDEMDMDYSNISMTTIPMRSLKGFFYMKAGFYREALDFFNEGTNHNPYLYFSESYKSFSHLNLKNYDSAYYFAKMSFNKLPGNVVHFANYALSLVHKGDSVELKSAYDRAIHKKEMHDELYLTAMADIIDEESNEFALENFDFISESENDNMKMGYYTLKIGRGDMMEAGSNHAIGEYYFENKDFESARNHFEKAANLNPYELTYKENLANAHLKLGNFQTAADILTQLIEIDGAKSVKVKYLLVLAYLNLEDNTTACLYIDEIKDEPLVKNLELGRFCN